MIAGADDFTERRALDDEAGGTDTDDRHDVQLALLGDEAAWYRLVERHRLYVYRLAYRVTFHEDDAMDATQSAFMKVAGALSGFDGKSAFRTWMTTVTLRAALDVCRARRTDTTAVDPATLVDVHDDLRAQPDTRHAIHDRLDAARRLALVQQAAERLSPQQRAIVLMAAQHDLSLADVARQLDLPANQVRSQYARAVQRLREILHEDAPETDFEKHNDTVELKRT